MDRWWFAIRLLHNGDSNQRQEPLEWRSFSRGQDLVPIRARPDQLVARGNRQGFDTLRSSDGCPSRRPYYVGQPARSSLRKYFIGVLRAHSARVGDRLRTPTGMNLSWGEPAQGIDRRDRLGALEAALVPRGRKYRRRNAARLVLGRGAHRIESSGLAQMSCPFPSAGPKKQGHILPAGAGRAVGWRRSSLCAEHLHESARIGMGRKTV